MERPMTPDLTDEELDALQFVAENHWANSNVDIADQLDSIERLISEVRRHREHKCPECIRIHMPPLIGPNSRL